MEAIPTSTGAYVIWSQDLEGPMGVPEETAAAIIATMWAARELFTLNEEVNGQCTPITGHQMMVVPTPASILQKSPVSTDYPKGWNLLEVVRGAATDNYVKFLDLDGNAMLSSENQTALAQNKIDLLSFLHLATAESVPLIDGILAQQYSSQGCTTDPITGCLIDCTHLNCEALPGQLSKDTPDFFDTTMPYAIQSAASCPAQLFLDPLPACSLKTRPWATNYRGTLPMRAGVYWAGIEVDPSFVPEQYLIPNEVIAEGCLANLDGNATVDARDLSRLLSYWGTPLGDINGDGQTNAMDLEILLNEWGSVCSTSEGTDWVKVLIAENAPPADLQTYVDKIKMLAPTLEQIHLRYPAGAQGIKTYQMYADLIQKLRAAYGSSLEIGFHPDNSNSSCALWECTAGACNFTSAETWQCVLSRSIEAMNAINQIADPSKSGTGFTIFSIEQGYVQDVGSSLALIKRCLKGDGSALPAVTPADPPARFGNVLPSYGGTDLYGTEGYDFGYPQYYNLGKTLTPESSVLLEGSSPYFSSTGAADCLNGVTSGINVVDVNPNTGGYQAPKIPCFGETNGQNVYMVQSDGSLGADPGLASAYVGYLMTQYPPISNTVALGGSEVFITFSGETSFLGSNGWTLEKIGQFNDQLSSNFDTLKQQVPTLFPAGGADPKTIKYAIWNFQAILDALVLP